MDLGTAVTRQPPPHETAPALTASISGRFPSGAVAGDEHDLLAAELDTLTRTQLGALAAFDLPIDPHLARLDHRMCGTARAHQADSLEQLIELDVIAANGKGNAHEALRKGFGHHPHAMRTGVAMSESGNCRPFHLPMNSFSATAPLDCRSNALLDLSEKTIRNALATGALQPIETESTTLTDRGFSFSVRWVSSLALKDRARVDTVTRRRPDFNPFLPPEPALTVSRLGAQHFVVLNKFPVIDHHLLIVTRAFEAQTAPLTKDDFRALATVLAAQGGLGFYNGGSVAGASQPHKHLQWVPEAALRADDGFATFSSGLDSQQTAEAQTRAELPWQHAFMSLADIDWCDAPQAGRQLQLAFESACRALSLPSNANPMPPYNLLASRQWLLVVPRQFEKWQDVSVNALGYAGSLFVRSPAQIERLRAEGPLAVLRAVGYPR